ncbi:MAG: metal-dependent hydrolase [Bacteroidia bacterium]|jgi:L-ascorbate metabolism protein UlaG (beta-lactamase superfamily)
MHLTYFGHSCFLADVGGLSILFDPFIRPNPLASHVKVDSIRPDIIAISHAHGDHIADAEEIARESGAKLLSNYEITSWFNQKGIENTVGMNTGGRFKSTDVAITLTQALHSSSFPDGSYGGNPNGFMVKMGQHSFYYAGDTDIFGDMALIARLHAPQFAILPIGDHFTMGIASACEAAKLLGVKRVIGMHYNTFPPIAIDEDEAKAHFINQGVELLLLPIGNKVEMA